MSAVGVALAERGARTDEYIAAMRALWTQPGPVEYHGRFVDFGGVDAHPRPAQPGGPRIVVGGHSTPAFRRAVAHGHGWYGFALTPDAAAHCVAELRRAASEVERPPELGDLEISVTPRSRLDAQAIDAFVAAGVHRLVPNLIGSASPEDVEDRLRGAAKLVL
jgi:alkanesulfonate monooxygenase SsuD/methylene tetrahydromethanopterin reductase-like flavin-dependent oxidoreductase (luciferase family)